MPRKRMQVVVVPRIDGTLDDRDPIVCDGALIRINDASGKELFTLAVNTSGCSVYAPVGSSLKQAGRVIRGRQEHLFVECTKKSRGNPNGDTP